MAKEIRWSLRAERDRQEIEEYWTHRNRSNTYSLALDQLFRDGVNLLAEMPESGKRTRFPFVRFKIIRDYNIYYRISSTHIELITIWDNRRNPKKLKL